MRAIWIERSGQRGFSGPAPRRVRPVHERPLDLCRVEHGSRLRPAVVAACWCFLERRYRLNCVANHLCSKSVMAGVVNTIIMAFCTMALGILLSVVAAFILNIN